MRRYLSDPAEDTVQPISLVSDSFALKIQRRR